MIVSSGKYLAGHFENAHSLMATTEQDRYKTKLCNDFERCGVCPRQNQCPFAHGQAELKTSKETSKLRPELNKTQLCKRFSMQGFCSTGESCAFAHGRHELRPIGMTNETFDAKVKANPLYKTQLCLRFQNGGKQACSTECEFAHGPNELRTMAPETIEVKQTRQIKTEMCKHFLKHGHCALGDRCNFAHGDTELRSQELDDALRYKTVICKNFSANGICERMDKCNFAHGPEELRSLEDNKKYIEANQPIYGINPIVNRTPQPLMPVNNFPPNHAFFDPNLTYEQFLIYESGDPNIKPPLSYQRYITHINNMSSKRAYNNVENGDYSSPPYGPPESKRPLLY